MLKAIRFKLLACASSLLIVPSFALAQESLPFPSKTSGSKAGPTITCNAEESVPNGHRETARPRSISSS